MAKIVNNNKLKDSLISDLKLVNIPTDFDLEFRDYSKSYYGTYDCLKKKIVVYINNEQGKVMSYEEILDTTLHEAIHHYQFCHNDNYIRMKGVMHDPEFHFLFGYKVEELKDMGVFEDDYTPH